MEKAITILLYPISHAVQHYSKCSNIKIREDEFDIQFDTIRDGKLAKVTSNLPYVIVED